MYSFHPSSDTFIHLSIVLLPRQTSTLEAIQTCHIIAQVIRRRCVVNRVYDIDIFDLNTFARACRTTLYASHDVAHTIT